MDDCKILKRDIEALILKGHLLNFIANKRVIAKALTVRISGHR